MKKGFIKSKWFISLVTVVVMLPVFAVALARNSHAQTFEW